MRYAWLVFERDGWTMNELRAVFATEEAARDYAGAFNSTQMANRERVVERWELQS